MPSPSPLSPALVAEWHPSLNAGLNPSDVSAGSGRPVWWLCIEGHHWRAKVGQRSAGSKCPFCSNKKAWPGFNDLATTHPALAEEWHPSLNGSLTPEQVLRGSRLMVWWKCSAGHEWNTSVVSRAVASTGCGVCAGKHPDRGVNTLDKTHPDLLSEWAAENSVTPDTVTYGSDTPVLWVCVSCEHEWWGKVRNRTAGKGCPSCATRRFISKPEQELQTFIGSHCEDAVFNTKAVISPYELDVYIPSMRVAVEFNGLYWHSEAQGKGSSYHHAKWLACKEQGIQLVQVWEDEWRDKPELVKQLLLHKLSLSEMERVPARKTSVGCISYGEASNFLNQFHIQGASRGSLYVGLKTEDALVAVMVLMKRPAAGEYEIVRYATSAVVPGGFSRLVAFVERHFPQVEALVSFSDHCVSDGGLYRQNGFSEEGELPPDYRYLYRGQREHKFGFRLKRFRNDPALRFVEGFTEAQLASLNGLLRVWDAGKTRWVRTVGKKIEKV